VAKVTIVLEDTGRLRVSVSSKYEGWVRKGHSTPAQRYAADTLAFIKELVATKGDEVADVCKVTPIRRTGKWPQ
jgi:hypothetical protein